jgi:hypothetical protein
LQIVFPLTQDVEDLPGTFVNRMLLTLRAFCCAY